MTNPGQPEPRWWQTWEYRRRYVSDLTWFGAAIATAFGASASVSLLFLLPAAVGVAMVVAGVRRAWRRIDPESGESRPAPPW